MDLQYLKSVLKYALSAVLSVVLIAYILYHIVSFQQSNNQKNNINLYRQNEKEQIFSHKFYKFSLKTEYYFLNYLQSLFQNMTIKVFLCLFFLLYTNKQLNY